jgi:hypothetical protein
MTAMGPLPERVAVIEADVRSLASCVHDVKTLQGHQEALLNTICVNVATLTTEVKNITMERTIWKNPLIYISFVSVIVAGIALLK